MPSFTPGVRSPSAVLRWCEIDAPPSGLLACFDGLRAETCPWWLDSALVDPRIGRFSFLGADPALIVRMRGRRIELQARRTGIPGLAPGFHRIDGEPLETLRALLPHVALEPALAPPELPFIGGLVGHLGYEIGACTEPVSLRARAEAGFPDASLLWADRLIAVDHLHARTFALGWGFGAAEADAAWHAEASLEVCRRWLLDAPMRNARSRPAAPIRTLGPAPDDLAHRRELLSRNPPDTAQISLDGSGFSARVDELIDEITAGNVYEVNLTRRISVEFDGDPLRLYAALRRESPAPFAAYFELPDGSILSSSPERFLRLSADRHVESRPIKGTRPRGCTAVEDARFAEALAHSEKDRAENLMIVDLVRNDLGRVCETGSIRVPELMVVEAYAAVFQLVSTITGRLRGDRDAVDLIRATFPPGSMTGAPKIAAMRLIDRLEPVRRGVYSGAIGYFDVRGGMDLSVVIRTILVEKGRAHFHVGGAIVADSTAAAEHAEALDKARAMLAALASLDET
jgi:para-aminobenzoate synthetase component 1